VTHVEINGAAPSVEALHQVAAWGFGHYTSMQVRGRAVAGLDLHLRRLREASAELFPGDPAPPDGTIVDRGTLAVTHHALEARRAGFDDVLFVGHGGLVLEGSVWNAVFWDGDRIVWPRAPMLAGITMQVLRRTLTAMGLPHTERPIPLSGTTGLSAAAATNSHVPGQAIQSIDEINFPAYGHLTALLRRAWAEVPWQAIPPAHRA
jgi:branched-subunit amino acid aminotransferase/4-amino-4-deoxychorismate lyase